MTRNRLGRPYMTDGTRARRLASISAAAVLLTSATACQAFPQYQAAARAFGEMGVASAKQAADDARDLNDAAECATTLGAHYRDPNPDHRRAREILCGGASLQQSVLSAQPAAPVSPITLGVGQ